ncbi:MAG: ESX secretion-associated protein EspG, partial [Dietzia sp.]|nr:ESX secretion-associated protein EspG [Dietzia sp.]
LSRPDRTLDCRWWRRDAGGKMVRFVVCRKGERHVVAARDEDMLVLQRVAPQIGLAGMVNVVVGTATPADVEPLTGIAAKLAEARSAEQLAKYGLPPSSARIYADATGRPDSWVEITANERHPGGTYSQAGVGAGVLDSAHGRIVSIPRRVNGELYGSFLPGTPENLQRALNGLIEFLPSGTWFDHKDVIDRVEADAATPD